MALRVLVAALLVSCRLGFRVARSSCILAEGAIAQTVTLSRATLFANTKLSQFPSYVGLGPTKMRYKFVSLVFSWKAYALAHLGALVMGGGAR
jgi:predicted DNA-binding transcriptional regulator AlpA